MEIGGAGNDFSPSDGTAGPSGDVQQQRPAVRVRREARRTAADRLVGIMANENENEEDLNTGAKLGRTLRDSSSR